MSLPVKKGDVLPISLPFTCEWAEGQKSGRMRMRLFDCVADITDGEERVGSVTGCLGGGCEVHFKLPGGGFGETWFVSAREIWNAVCRARGREDMVMADPVAAARGEE